MERPLVARSRRSQYSITPNRRSSAPGRSRERGHHSHLYPSINSRSWTSTAFVTGSSVRFPPPGAVILSCHLAGGSVGDTSIVGSTSFWPTCSPPNALLRASVILFDPAGGGSGNGGDRTTS